MMVHQRRFWPAFIQHWVVLYAGGCVSTEYKMTPTQCSERLGQRRRCWPASTPLNTGQCFMLAAVSPHSIHSNIAQCLLNVDQRRRRWSDIRLMHDTPTHCSVNGGLAQDSRTSTMFRSKAGLMLAHHLCQHWVISVYIMQV